MNGDIAAERNLTRLPTTARNPGLPSPAGAEPMTGQRTAMSLPEVDLGAGIPAERHGEVFQPFNRLGAEESAIEGTGIGLAISHRLATLMQGTLAFESEAGKGSTFWLDLPTAGEGQEEQAAADGGADASVARFARDEKVYALLYVEDNPPNIALMQQLVGSIPNLRLLAASDPNTGIALAHAHRPDIIVLDINLPGMHGFEGLRRLKQAERTGHIPVMALTAAAQPQDVERGRQAGFAHYLTKPTDVQQFLTAVDDILDRIKDGV